MNLPTELESFPKTVRALEELLPDQCHDGAAQDPDHGERSPSSRRDSAGSAGYQGEARVDKRDVGGCVPSETAPSERQFQISGSPCAKVPELSDDTEGPPRKARHLQWVEKALPIRHSNHSVSDLKQAGSFSFSNVDGCNSYVP